MFRFRLRFLFGELDITSETFVIGRSPLCNLPIEDPLVSRQHARITVYEDYALLDDLGSRNGTLVNGQPVFDDYRLNHSDCIRIGNNELIFIKEQIQIPTKYSHDNEHVECPGCGKLLPLNNSVCSGCGSVFIPDYICLNCHLPVGKDDRACKRCGAAVDNDDSTIPVELGGRESGWNSKLTDDVIETALSVQRYPQAARLLDDKIQEFETSKEFDQKVLVKISQFNLAIAKEFKDSGRMTWIIEQFSRRALPMPDSLLRNFEEAALGWYDMKQDIQGYIDAIESNPSRLDNHEIFLQRLYDLIA
jgi:predicted amidophosphoribosyltransferase